MKLILNIKDGNILDKLLRVLRHFQEDGVEIVHIDTEEEEWDEAYLETHWREIGMSTHSADLDDDQELYRACAEYYSEKHSG